MLQADVMASFPPPLRGSVVPSGVRSLRLTFPGASAARDPSSGEAARRRSRPLASRTQIVGVCSPNLNQSGSRALLLVQAPAAGKGTPLPHRPHRGIPTESAHVTTTIDTDHPLFNTNRERMRINAALRHLGSGADLRDFPASPSEKVALVKTASQRGLITWHKGRGRYELTATGWCELAPTRRFGVGSMMLGTTVGATVGAVALAVFWFT